MDFSEELSKFEVGSKERVFIEKVLEKLGPNFVRKSVEERKREAHGKLNRAMENYFQSYVVASAITKSAEQLETSQEASVSSGCIPSVYLGFAQKYLSSESSSELKLFGLNHETALRAIQNRNSKLETERLKKLIENNIIDFCIKLTNCVGGNTISPGEDWKNAFDRTIKDLEDKITLLASEEAKQQRSEKQLKDMTKTYYEELSKGILLMSKLITLHSEKLEFESNLSKFYLLRCQAISLKVKAFGLKMLAASYNEETVPALKKISVQLDQNEQKLKEEQNEKTVALEQYLKLGEEYERFVDEYTHLTKSIREQQWAIDELKNRNSQYGVSGHD